MFYFAIIFTTPFLPVATGVVTNDALGGNLTWQWDPLPGACPKLSTDLFECNVTKYDGRWYMAYASLTPDFVHDLACTMWDTFFDRNGNFHNFLHSLQKGEVKVFASKSTKIPGTPGIYSMHFGAATSPNNSYYSSLYYMDNEMMIFRGTKCYIPDTQYRDNIQVLIRNLDWMRDKEAQLQRIMKILQTGSYNVTLTPISHPKSCNYPPVSKNPYT